MRLALRKVQAIHEEGGFPGQPWLRSPASVQPTAHVEQRPARAERCEPRRKLGQSQPMAPLLSTMSSIQTSMF